MRSSATKGTGDQAHECRVQNNLAWMLATAPQVSLRNGSKAVGRSTGGQLAGGLNAMILRTLAATYAESGRFPEAA